MEYYQDTVLVDKQEKQEYSRRMTPKKHRFSNLTVCIEEFFCFFYGDKIWRYLKKSPKTNLKTLKITKKMMTLPS